MPQPVARLKLKQQILLRQNDFLGGKNVVVYMAFGVLCWGLVIRLAQFGLVPVADAAGTLDVRGDKDSVEQMHSMGKLIQVQKRN